MPHPHFSRARRVTPYPAGPDYFGDRPPFAFSLAARLHMRTQDVAFHRGAGRFIGVRRLRREAAA